MKKLNEWDKIVLYFEKMGYELISTDYKNTKSRIEYICPKHRDKGIQSATWNQLKSKNTGCKYCANEYTGLLRRKPEEEIIALVEERGLIYDHTEYVNGKSKIFYKCPKHIDKGTEITSLASLNNTKIICPWCSHRKKDKDSLQKEINNIHDNIIVIGEYVSSTTKMEFLCTIHNKTFMMTPNNLLRGQNCPLCGRKKNSKSRTKTKYEFIDEISKKFKDEILLVSDYNGARKNITCKCVKHNYKFEIIASNLANSSTVPCPICRAENTRERCVKSNEQFLKELKLVNPNIIPLEEYKNENSKILCRCKIHNYEWYVSPSKILHRKTGCPKCCIYHNENIILDILDKWGYNYTIQKRFKDCKDKNTLPFDVYLNDFNICIEYDGEQHYRPIRRGSMTKEDAKKNLELITKHDRIKTDYCLNNKIGLIRIPYWERENMEIYLFDQLVNLKAIELIS